MIKQCLYFFRPEEHFRCLERKAYLAIIALLITCAYAAIFPTISLSRMIDSHFDEQYRPAFIQVPELAWKGEKFDIQEEKLIYNDDKKLILAITKTPEKHANAPIVISPEGFHIALLMPFHGEKSLIPSSMLQLFEGLPAEDNAIPELPQNKKMNTLDKAELSQIIDSINLSIYFGSYINLALNIILQIFAQLLIICVVIRISPRLKAQSFPRVFKLACLSGIPYVLSFGIIAYFTMPDFKSSGWLVIVPSIMQVIFFIRSMPALFLTDPE